MNRIMLNEMMKFMDKYNAAMNNNDSFDEYSKELIKAFKLLVKKYPREIEPLHFLRSLTCKSRNQTEHIKLLNKLIKIDNNDMLKNSLVDCKKQPCNKCSVWDDIKTQTKGLIIN